MEPCPLHDECERHLPPQACEYRSGEITREEAESKASASEGYYGGDGVFADNH